MELFTALGFRWNRSKVPHKLTIHSIERVNFRYHRMLPEFVWEASVLEGNPFTFTEVKTLLDGVTVGGRKLSDQEQVLNLATSSKQLLALVNTNQFSLDKTIFTELNGLVARNTALGWGHFRGEGNVTDETKVTPYVDLGKHGRYTSKTTETGALELNRIFSIGLDALQLHVQHPFEKAFAFFLFGSLHKFFFNGNKCTSRLMMNGILMSAGIDALSIPADKVALFNEKMIQFYLKKDATEMMEFLINCHLDAKKMN